MCGICGFIQFSGGTQDSIKSRVLAMANTLKHRGPDSSGVWIQPVTSVAFGHRRLSILDLSESGHQPMTSHSGRFTICYNGEVYNHPALRKELEQKGHSFKGSSDTETILAAIDEWGLQQAVSRCIGMFSFALWDDTERTLHLVRDRLGIKPLYYGMAGSTFLFGSELKALQAHPDFDCTVDRNALSLFFRHAYIPSPHSILSGVHKLPPGSILSIGPDREKTLFTYWSLTDVWANGTASPYQGTRKDAADQLEYILQDAVGLRMLSDVPIGAFLSGGIDSSTVVALMQQANASPVKTFSIGFHEDRFNEAPMAAAIAEHLGTDHTELYVTPIEMLEVIPKIPELWDEPFGDSSQIPTYCLSQLTRNQVTVSLSGDGGDELFHGYNRYFTAIRAWEKVTAIPASLRNAASASVPALAAIMGQKEPFSSKLLRRLQLIGLKGFQDFYYNIVSQDKKPAAFVLGANEPGSALTEDYSRLSLDRHQLMSLLDSRTYLTDDILTKVDRASMAASLEARVPILDHRVVEFAASLPADMNIKGGIGKQLLRDVLARHVPCDLFERPKKGFGVPLAAWLRKDLRDWAESLLDEKRIASQGYINAATVRRMWNNFLDGDDGRSAQVWNTLMFQAWLERWKR